MPGGLKHTLKATAFYTCFPSRNSFKEFTLDFSFNLVAASLVNILVQSDLSNFKSNPLASVAITLAQADFSVLKRSE